jgi:endonuclease I
MMKKIYVLIISLGACYGLYAFNKPVTPAKDLPTYYKSIDGTSDKALLGAIQQVAKIGYRTDDFRYDSVWLAFKHTDIRPDGYIWEIYSTCVFEYEKDRTSNTTQTGECKGYNREHAMCQSWFGTTSLAGKEMSSSKKNSPGSDIFHIYPASYGMNSRRGNRPYGEVQSAAYTSENGTKYGTPVTTISVANSVAGPYVEGKMTLSTNVLEPADEYKGDIARSYFGTMVKWAGEWAFNMNENGRVIFDATIDLDTHYGPENNYGLTDYGLAMLLKWHRQDPVSQKEVDRNNGIQLTQGNRNPFIDYPYLVEYLWGEKSGQEVDMDLLICSADERFQLDMSNGFLGADNDILMDTIYWMVGETVYDMSIVRHNSRPKSLPKAPVSCSLISNIFMGWTNTPILAESPKAPAILYTQVSELPITDGNMRYYAVFAEVLQEAEKETITLNKTDSTGWILDGLKQTKNSTDGAYWLLVKDATITSPVVDLQALDSISMTIRSYQSKKIVAISAGGSNIGQLSANTNTMQRYVCVVSGLTGNQALSFTSTDGTASYGPGVCEISIYLGGENASYTNYLTHCNTDPNSGLDQIVLQNDVQKILHDGKLYIRVNEQLYDTMGRVMNQ